MYIIILFKSDYDSGLESRIRVWLFKDQEDWEIYAEKMLIVSVATPEQCTAMMGSVRVYRIT